MRGSATLRPTEWQSKCSDGATPSCLFHNAAIPISPSQIGFYSQLSVGLAVIFPRRVSGLWKSNFEWAFNRQPKLIHNLICLLNMQLILIIYFPHLIESLREELCSRKNRSEGVHRIIHCDLWFVTNAIILGLGLQAPQKILNGIIKYPSDFSSCFHWRGRRKLRSICKYKILWGKIFHEDRLLKMWVQIRTNGIWVFGAAFSAMLKSKEPQQKTEWLPK